MGKRDACQQEDHGKIKEVLRLKFEADLSHERIAAATGVSKGAVTKYVQRAVSAEDASIARGGEKAMNRVQLQPGLSTSRTLSKL